MALLVLLAGVLAGCLRYQQAPLKVQLAPPDNYVQLGRERIFVQDSGKEHSGAAVLLIHGYGSAHDAWARITPALAKSHRVLAVDLPGFGRSDKYPGDYSPAGLAKKLVRLLEKKKVGDVHLVAHSWGSSIALAFALANKARVRSLTLMGAWVFEEQLNAFLRWSRIPGVGEALYTLFFAQRLDDRLAMAFYDPEPFSHPRVVDAVRRQLGRPGAVRAALQAARQQRFSAMQKRYASIESPALLIWGEQDPVSLLSFAHRLDRTLPRSTLQIIPQCGHIPALERPQRVLQLLLPFLAKQGARGARRRAPSSTPASAPSAGGAR